MSSYTWIVVIVRESLPEITGFHDKESALEYFETFSPNWSESYLCEVIIGPKV